MSPETQSILTIVLALVGLPISAWLGGKVYDLEQRLRRNRR